MTMLTEKPTASRSFQRIIGVHTGRTPGPSLVCVGGIHGNETSGIVALERVFDTLAQSDCNFRGELTGIAGNLQALRLGDRYMGDDLNRVWMPERVALLERGGPPDLAPEDWQEMSELHGALSEAFDRATGEVAFLDLHTSSAPGEPFVLLGDTIRNRRFAFRFPAPVILGLEETIDGVLLEHVNSLGHITIGFEAGQHDDPQSICNQEAAIWIMLNAAGCVDANQIPAAREAFDILRRQTQHLPAVMEIRRRHPVEAGDGFKMRPGFRNFQLIEAGELLADTHEGQVLAEESGRILLPLYQGQGNDGYFLGRSVSRFWLRVSYLLRRLHVHRLASWLPGVRRDPDHDACFIVDKHVARFFPLQIMHLMGFRKVRQRGDTLIVSRRRFDLRGPNGRLA